MGGHVVFAGININYIIDQISVKKSQNHRVTPYVGQDGSDVSFVSSESRILSFKSLCLRDETSPHNRGHRVNDYIWLAENYNKTSKALTSPSESDIDGNYIITGFDYTEDTNHNYELSWEFTEQITFNVTQKTFRVWNKAQAKNSNKANNTKKTKTNQISSNTKYLLKNCPVMGRKVSYKGKQYKDIKGIKCVKCLQIYLQSQGYYKKYKLDGWYNTYTEEAVKGLQKKYKLKTSGVWDKTTIKYFQKKYKYPTTDILTKSTKQLSKIKGPITRQPQTTNRS